ncbi:acid phosphatase [OM182 bacterium]|nr:acid phosphatase [OM182 bacterium]
MVPLFSKISFFQEVKTQFRNALSQYFCFFILGAPLLYISPIKAQIQETNNPLAYSVAWKQTAAEHRALFHQGFNIATLRVQQAIAARTNNESKKPLAVITDIDETVLLANAYWGYLIDNNQDFFDDMSWDQWVAYNEFSPSPGSIAFLKFCEINNVEVFYVTNRNQGEETFQLALNNLRAAQLPFAFPANLRVLRSTSNKEEVQNKIREKFEVIALLGDNLNDFSRKYYSIDVDERAQLMSEDSARFGKEYILFPNPTDGHWIRAIFGQSEPAPNDANRKILRDAASKERWSPNINN